MEFNNEFNLNISCLVANPKNTIAFDSAIKIIANSHPLHAENLRKKLSKVSELSTSIIKKCEKTLKSIPLTHSQIANDFIQDHGEIPLCQTSCRA